jgi:hypothetical protein
LGDPGRRGRATLTEKLFPESALPQAGSADTLVVELALASSMLRYRRLARTCSVLVVLAVTGYRLSAVGIARYPGHADPAFYFQVADNLAAGRGPSVNYVWHFLNGFPPLHHYAFDYWLPGTSILMAAALKVHPSLSAALYVNIAMSVLLAIGTYLLARLLSRTWWVPPVAMAVVMLQPNVSALAVQTEGGIYLAAFGVLGMSAAIVARKRPGLWLVAGLLAGLANLCRSEGLLLFAVMAVAAFGSSEARRRVRALLTLTVGYLLVMAPLFVVNLRRIGSPLPRSTSKTPFITSYEQIFSLHVDSSIGALLDRGLDGFFLDRLTALQQHVGWAFQAFAPIDAVLLTILAGGALFHLGRSDALGRSVTWHQRALGSPWFVPLGFAAAVFGFWALVAPAASLGGGPVKCLATIMPVFVIGALMQLDRLAVPGRAGLAICLVIVAVPVADVARSTVGPLVGNNATGSAAAELRPMLRSEQACLDRPVVLMTRNPWEISQATGFPTVQIPNAPLPEILQVASRYGVTDIELTPARRALADDKRLLESRVISMSAHFAQRPIFRLSAAVSKPSC